MLQYSLSRKENLIADYLELHKGKTKDTKIVVHENCRKDFTNPLRESHQLSSTSSNENTYKRRSQVMKFEGKLHCLFCGKNIEEDSKHPDRNPSHKAEIPNKESIIRKCTERGDDWASEVKMRLEGCTDLVAADVRYHRQCRVNFFIARYKPSESSGIGRPQDKDQDNCFNKLCSWLESQTEVFTLREIEEEMKKISGTGDAYTVKYIEMRLKSKYKEYVYFVKSPGLPTKVIFRDMENYILSEFWNRESKENKDPDRQEDKYEDNIYLIKTAANLILNEVRCMDTNTEYYPTTDDINSSYHHY